ncbi:hypothetical protein LAZ67_18000215 [Cordylochernes scorpioides]|uniref:Mos1 transposase HTH domain-containing protein n=1 Tax=Cordylochernes scorpioides TaxID=51811 RepID=A0ABY6LER7_9ARAC|nr:hypothetical protein LAZ67_18000215 [Cordylochernes scorpioides]
MEAPLKDCTTLEQRAVIGFLNAEGIQTSQICQRMKNIYGESCLSQRNIYKWVNEFKNGRIKCTDIERPGRPSVTATPSTINAVENLILKDIKISIFTIGNLNPGIRNKRRGKLSKGVLFLHDNARPHTSCKTVSTIIKLGFEVLEHPAFSPDLAPSDYSLFGLLKKELKEKRFDSDEDVQKVMQDFFTRFLRVPIKRRCMETSEALHWAQQQQKIDIDPEQQLYTPKIKNIATAVIERCMETSEALHWTQQQQKIDIDPEQQLYTPKIKNIATAVIEMYGDI